MQLRDALLGPGLKMFLKIHHKKFLIFQEIELSCSNIFFSKFIFQQMEILKKLLTLHSKLRKKNYKSGNGNFKRITYIFSKGNGNLEKNTLCFRKQKPPKTSLYFRKRNFFIFMERYIQNASIFRTRSISRRLTHLELVTYSEHWYI